MSIDGLKRRLREFGAPSRGIRSLKEQPTPDHVRYLDLMHRPEGRPDAVVEMGGEPIAYAVDTVHAPQADIGSLQRSLVFRGDAPYLAVLSPGQLTVYSLGSEVLEQNSPQPAITVQHNASDARTTFQRLFHVPEPLPGALSNQAIHERLFDLLSATVDELVDLELDRGDALSLSGRAMFTKFLVDRDILAEDHWSGVAKRATQPEDFFSTAENAAATCRWLDSTFNGDFLPLSFKPNRSAFGRFPKRVFQNLSDIMRCRRGGQLYFKWEDIDLSNVPAGLLSQVYEHQAQRWNPYARHTTGVYYTPRRVAEYMVAEVMASVRSEIPDQADRIRVLDPAVGGGVFIVAFFRELVAERWRNLQRHPNSGEIRSILYDQLAGFDISEPALRLTALSLYLTALELDPDPQPLSELKFSPLRESVLFDTREDDAISGGAVLGSLRDLPDHRHKYDVVIANPPWTALKGTVAREIEREINVALVEENLPVPVRLPDKVPDLGFLWFSTVWARPDGWIAMAMHARLLFKQSGPGLEARNLLLSKLDLTGILNGSELRSTGVWPGMSAPFGLLFARNREPNESSAFYFVSPVQEVGMNTQGRFRVDAEAAHPVSPHEVRTYPHLLKALFRGSALDVSLLRRVREVAHLSLEAYWAELGLVSGQGYKLGHTESQDASSLIGMPDLGSSKLVGPVVDAGSLPLFEQRLVDRVRSIGIYSSPLVLVRKSPPSSSTRASSRANCLSWQDVAFSESLYGWSTAGHAAPEDLARYLFVLVNSDLFSWHALVTSGEFGVERESIQKRDVDAFPTRAFEDLSKGQVRDIKAAFDAYCEDPLDTSLLNTAVGDVYGLATWEVETMRDTLATRSPYRDSTQWAESAPETSEVSAFEHRLGQLLRSVIGIDVPVVSLEDHTSSPWQGMMIGKSAADSSIPQRVGPALQSAERGGASRVVVHDEGEQVLLVYTLRQRRYFTLSKARLLTLELIREHAGLWT